MNSNFMSVKKKPIATSIRYIENKIINEYHNKFLKKKVIFYYKLYLFILNNIHKNI
jgi:hypothetical protein